MEDIGNNIGPYTKLLKLWMESIGWMNEKCCNRYKPQPNKIKKSVHAISRASPFCQVHVVLTGRKQSNTGSQKWRFVTTSSHRCWDNVLLVSCWVHWRRICELAHLQIFSRHLQLCAPTTGFNMTVVFMQPPAPH